MLRTPLRRSDWLSRVTGGEVYLKLEIVQPTSSYKIRGRVQRGAEAPGRADDRLSARDGVGRQPRTRARLRRGIALGIPLTVFIAADAPRTKIDAIRRAGSRVEAVRDYDEAERQAEVARGRESAASTFRPYSHPDVIAGAGTILLEVLDDLPELDTVVAPVGGGGLISGIGIAAKARSPSTRVIGVEVAASSPFTHEPGRGSSRDDRRRPIPRRWSDRQPRSRHHHFRHRASRR